MTSLFIHFPIAIAGEVPEQEEAGRAAPTGPWTVRAATASSNGSGGEITPPPHLATLLLIFRQLILVLGHESFGASEAFPSHLLEE